MGAWGGGGICLKDGSESILVDYWLLSFSPWLASISLGVAQDLVMLFLY